MFGQGLTLKQCIEYAKVNNENQKIAEYDVNVAQKKISEQTGSILPQIDASASYTDNLKLQKTVMPGDMFGKPGESLTFSMGSQHNVSAGIQLSQKVFDPTFPVAFKAAKVNTLYYQQNQRKILEQTVYNVASAYYQCLIISKQCNTLKATLASSEKLLATTGLKFQNGMADKLDVDKIQVSCNSTRTQLIQNELNFNQSLNSLKFQMGMPVGTAIELSDTAFVEVNFDDAYLIVNKELNIENRIDYQLQKTNVTIQELQKKQQVMSYLPSLNFSAAFNYNAMRNEFDFFKSGQPWYNSYYIGLSLKVPIFDGFQKHSRVVQSNLNIQKSRENVRLMEQSIRLNVSNYEMQYKNAVDNIRNEKENLDLAESVYAKTQKQYQEGTTTALDLVQSESSLRESQNNYYNKLFSLFTARLDLEQSKGTLLNYLSNFK
jgi:Outer membrane protein